MIRCPLLRTFFISRRINRFKKEIDGIKSKKVILSLRRKIKKPKFKIMKLTQKYLITISLALLLFSQSFGQAPATSTPPTSTAPATSTTMSNNVSSDPNLVVDSNKYRGWSITLHGGVTFPYVDIRNSDYPKLSFDPKTGNLGWGAGLGITKMFTSAFGVELNAMVGSLHAALTNDSNIAQYKNSYQKFGFAQPVYFKTINPMFSFNASIYVDWISAAMTLAHANRKPNSDRRVAIYSTFGLGAIFFSSEINDIATDTTYRSIIAGSGSNPKQFPLGRVGGYLRGYSGASTETEIPVSLGFKYKLSHSLDLGLQYQLHLVNSDKLDGWVKNLDDFNTGRTDKYSFTNVTLTYKFVGSDKSVDYIEWKNPIDHMYDVQADLQRKVKQLSTDSDGDGVPDMFDKCPNTPAGVVVDGSGCPLDIDGDGVPDYKDNQPFTPKGCKVDANGVAIDSDGDGVPDCLDKEPNTKPGALTNFQGITIPIYHPDTLAGIESMMPVVYFDFDMSNLKDQFYPELTQIARAMKIDPKLKIRITGNCDQRGGETFNNKLGQQRADACKNFIVTYFNIDPSRIDTKSLGKSQPLSPTFYAINRRADFEVTAK
jgi:outer membrane protein OmpA-like peptidoglycan-associated protein